MNLDLVLTSLTYLVLCFILFTIGKFVYGLFHKGIDVTHELVEKDNLAFAISHTGYFVGLLIVIGSAIVGPSNGIVEDAVDITFYGLLGILLLNISILINDKLILPHFNVNKEIIDDQNVGTGVIEAGNSIAVGLILYGAITGESSNIIDGAITGLSFWALGQVILIAVAKIYDIITPYDVHDHIEKDNAAVGIGFAGALIAMGNIIKVAISGDFISWEESLADLGITLLMGFVFLPVIRIATDKVLLPGQNLTDELINQEKPNHGAAIIEAFAYIGGSVLIGWCI